MQKTTLANRLSFRIMLIVMVMTIIIMAIVYQVTQQSNGSVCVIGRKTC